MDQLIDLIWKQEQPSRFASACKRHTRAYTHSVAIPFREASSRNANRALSERPGPFVEREVPIGLPRFS